MVLHSILNLHLSPRWSLSWILMPTGPSHRIQIKDNHKDRLDPSHTGSFPPITPVNLGSHHGLRLQIASGVPTDGAVDWAWPVSGFSDPEGGGQLQDQWRLQMMLLGEFGSASSMGLPCLVHQYP